MRFHFPPARSCHEKSIEEQLADIFRQVDALVEAGPELFDKSEDVRREVQVGVMMLLHGCETFIRTMERDYGPLHVERIRQQVEKDYYERGLYGVRA